MTFESRKKPCFYIIGHEVNIQNYIIYKLKKQSHEVGQTVLQKINKSDSEVCSLSLNLGRLSRLRRFSGAASCPSISTPHPRTTFFADLRHTTFIRCHPRAKAQIRGSRQIRGVRRKERGREKLRIKRRKAGRSREHSRSMFDTFWYNYLDEDEMMEL